ncbi:CD59B glycoprotein [Larimichthys crocea]|uniref:CD59B glycoprotein n=1 Tax=Larimichthys crocea TaxID=215358 RepID=UPI000900D6A2|nr:CD59B glycoprotein [Larimichthys crocea]
MKFYGVLLLLVTLSAACGLKCYTCNGMDSKSCTQIVECPSPTLDRCSSLELNGAMVKTCVMSSACVSPMKCCEGDLCNGAITTGSSVLLLLVSSAIITLFL